MKLPISDRLLACAQFVRPGDRVADVGCDHGYLSIHLLTEGIAAFCIASDINDGPLRSALRNPSCTSVRRAISFLPAAVVGHSLNTPYTPQDVFPISVPVRAIEKCPRSSPGAPIAPRVTLPIVTPITAPLVSGNNAPLCASQMPCPSPANAPVSSIIKVTVPMPAPLSRTKSPTRHLPSSSARAGVSFVTCSTPARRYPSAISLPAFASNVLASDSALESDSPLIS